MHGHAKLPPPTLTLSRQSTERSFRRCNTKIPTWHRRSRPTLNSLPAAGAIRKLNRCDAPTTHTTFRVPAPDNGHRRVLSRCFTGNIGHVARRSAGALRRNRCPETVTADHPDSLYVIHSGSAQGDLRAANERPRRSARRVEPPPREIAAHRVVTVTVRRMGRAYTHSLASRAPRRRVALSLRSTDIGVGQTKGIDRRHHSPGTPGAGCDDRPQRIGQELTDCGRPLTANGRPNYVVPAGSTGTTRRDDSTRVTRLG